MAKEPPRWSPFREVDRFRKDFDDLFDRFLGARTTRETARSPVIECFTEGENLVVRADLPGVSPKDVEVSAAGDQLTIRGVRKAEKDVQGRNFTHREVSYGSFERTVKLPAGINPEEIKASYRDGVLEVTAPIHRHSGVRKVPVDLEDKRSGS